jgi:carbohydrate kinase (thermoresistant glucokinase family)
MTNARTFPWTDDLLLALREAGLESEAVEPQEWTKRLAEPSDDALVNATKKHLEFFASKHNKKTVALSRTYETRTATSFSQALVNAPVLDATFGKTFARHFQASVWKPTSTHKP